jgi:hypothetical protein
MGTGVRALIQQSESAGQVKLKIRKEPRASVGFLKPFFLYLRSPCNVVNKAAKISGQCPFCA